jgi:hypothetical protein
MLARHPTTGEPIRILRIEPQISANHKTLVWVRAAFKASPKWKRWFPIVSEPAAVGNCGAESLCAVILTPEADLDAWLPLLPTVFTATSECLLIAPSAVIDALTARGFSCDRTLLWEDLHDSYPYLGEPIKGADGVEKVVVSLAHVLRIQRIAWSSSVERDTMEFGLKAQVDAWIRGCGGAFKSLSAEADDSCIPNTWLIQQFFIHPTARRAKEIRQCLQKNLACEWIDHVLLLDEQAYSEPPPSSKVTRHVIGHRLTYYDVFKAIESTVPAGDFAIFANSDIYFDDTLRHLWRIALVDQRLFLALLRWDVSAEGGEPTLYGPRADSQDAWIIARDSVTFPITEDEFGFPFGKPGCDNAITLSLMRNHCAVANPAYTIRSYHVHASNVRNYNPHDVLYRPHYLYVDPTAIQPCEVVRDLSRYAKAVPAEIAEARKKRPLGASFPRPLLGVSEGAVQTLCSMLRRDGTWVFTPTGANLWTPPPVTPPLYHFTGGAFVTPDGLVSTFNEIFVGKHPAWKAGWEAVRQSSLTNTIHVPHMIAIPCAEAWGSSLSAWVLHYLPRALDLRSLICGANLPPGRAPEFMIPHIPDVGAFLNDCVWSTGALTFVPHLKDVQYYSEDVWAVPPEDGCAFVTEEDVALLRDLLPKRVETRPTRPVAVFCVEDEEAAVCTRRWAESVTEHLLARGWIIHYVGANDAPSVRRKAFSEATWLFGSGAALDWIWMAPKEATVMEFMSDSAPIGDHVHLAAAAGLRYVVGLVKREPIEYQRQNALLDVGRAIRKHGFCDMLSLLRLPHSGSVTGALKPLVTLPTGRGLAGIWAHAGDTFREMAAIWAERGYVDLATTEDSGFCWWGEVGEVLLYDRPTPRWWAEIPSYQMALFGNCAPPGPDKHLLRQSVWSFWPRSPRVVEDFVARKETLLDYEERTIASLFLGKVENGVQRAHRCAVDWSTTVDLFSMPLDSTGAAYPYTQKGYLNKLCSARFGLCLPGFGPKCNREIEYFACGCVPIVVDGVDMKGYLVPPVEGIHYFRARSPEDVKRIVTETSVETWTSMSAAGREWWSTYASAEGLFRLTWARIEQCRPYFNVGIPSKFSF